MHMVLQGNWLDFKRLIHKLVCNSSFFVVT